MAISMLMPAGTMNFTENQQACIVFEKLWSQRESGRFCDIVLHVQGQKFQAHRNVLAACSPYFDSVLKTHKIIKEQLTVTCQNLDAFQLLLNYMYTGAVVIDKNNVSELLRLANHFLVLKLKNYCAEFLDRYLDLSNCLSVKDMADKYNLPALQKNVLAFIHSHIIEIFEQNEILELNVNKLQSFLKEKQCFISQHVLFNFIIKWVEHESGKRKYDLEKLLALINWDSVDRQYLDEQLKNNSFIRNNPKCMYYVLNCLEKNKIEVPEYNAVYSTIKSQFGTGGIYDQDDNIVSLYVQKSSLESNVEENTPVTVAPLEKEQPKEKTATEHQSEETIKESNFNESSNSSFDDIAPETTVNPDDDSQSSREKEKEKYMNIVKVSSQKENAESFLTESTTKLDEAQKTVTIIKLTSKSTLTPSFSNKCNIKNEKHNSKLLKQNQSPSNQAKKLERLEPKKRYMSESDTDTDDINDENEDNNGSSSATDSSVEESINGHINKSKWKDGVKCPNCAYVAHSSARLEQHVSRIHARDVTYKCKFCEFTCKWNREYYIHMKVHFEGPPYHCDGCEYSSARIQFFLAHRMRHTDERPFKCDECDHRCRTKANLEAHTRCHTGEKPYQCEHCERRFAIKASLDQHLATHREDRPYLCDTCGFSTKYQSHLFSHKRIHTGDVFRCHFPNCKYSTPKKSQLGSHHRTHTAVRSHICSICGRAFIEKSHLVRHERIHLNEKPFKCDHCDYCSSRRDKLKEHFRKHHGENATAKGPYRPRKQRRQGYEVSAYSPPNKNPSAESDNHQMLATQHIELQTAASSMGTNNPFAPVVNSYDTSHTDSIHSHAAVALQQLGAAAHNFKAISVMDQRYHHHPHTHTHIGPTSTVSSMMAEQNRVNVAGTSHDSSNCVVTTDVFHNPFFPPPIP